MDRRRNLISRFRNAAFWTFQALAMLALAAGSHAQEDMPHKRIVSINACADQLLWALADREDIAALTHYAASPHFFVQAAAVKASGIKLIEGTAEEVLKLKPGLVLAGLYTKRETRLRLEEFGVPIIMVPEMDSIEGARQTIADVSRMLGREVQGQALIDEIDRGAASLRAQGQAGLRVLQVQRRGFTAGAGTLLDDLLSQAGLSNAAAGLGIASVRRIALETVLKAQPDALILPAPRGSARDQGAALLRHPALVQAYPPSRQIVMPGNLLVCGGPSLPVAMEWLRQELSMLPAAEGKQEPSASDAAPVSRP